MNDAAIAEQPLQATRYSRRRASQPPLHVAVEVKVKQTRKRSASRAELEETQPDVADTTTTTTAAAVAEPERTAPQPSKQRTSTRLQHPTKSTITGVSRGRKAAKKSTSAAAAAAAVSLPLPDKEAVDEDMGISSPAPVPAAPAVDAAVLDFDLIMAADVIVHDAPDQTHSSPHPHLSLPAAATAADNTTTPTPGAAVQEGKGEEEEEALAMPPPPSQLPPSQPILAPEAVLVSPAPMVTPIAAPGPTPSHAKTASVLGKRSLMGLIGKTPATKRGRLGSMLATGSKPRPRSAAKASPPSPVNLRRMEIADLGSPAKPSPYADDWALPATSPALAKKQKSTRKGAGAAGRPPRGGGSTALGKKKTAVAKNMSHALEAAAVAAAAAAPADSAGESVGDAPLPSGPARPSFQLPKLGPLSPSAPHNEGDSDMEDEVMLQAAAHGELSPPQPVQDSPAKKRQQQPAATTSLLETTPYEALAVAVTPQSRLQNGRTKRNSGASASAGVGGNDGNGPAAKQQLHLTKLAAPADEATTAVKGYVFLSFFLLFKNNNALHYQFD